MEEAKPMTVKFIVTKYVEADATHFKSVVQSLTGKDSTVAAASAATARAAGVAEMASRQCQSGAPAPSGWMRSSNGGFLDAVPSIEEMVEFLRD